MDDVTAKLIISVDGSNKSYILWNGTEAYYKKLRAAYSDIVSDKESEYLYFSFFTLCSATLEFSLNFILTSYCLDHFGCEKYKSYAETYISLPFQKKLFMTPTIISNGKFAFNEGSLSSKVLGELIKLRNRILHNKEFLKEFDFPSLSEHIGKETVEFEIKVDLNHIDTLT